MKRGAAVALAAATIFGVAACVWSSGLLGVLAMLVGSIPLSGWGFVAAVIVLTFVRLWQQNDRKATFQALGAIALLLGVGALCFAALTHVAKNPCDEGFEACDWRCIRSEPFCGHCGVVCSPEERCGSEERTDDDCFWSDDYGQTQGGALGKGHYDECIPRDAACSSACSPEEECRPVDVERYSRHASYLCLPKLTLDLTKKSDCHGHCGPYVLDGACP